MKNSLMISDLKDVIAFEENNKIKYECDGNQYIYFYQKIYKTSNSIRKNNENNDDIDHHTSFVKINDFIVNLYDKHNEKEYPTDSNLHKIYNYIIHLNGKKQIYSNLEEQIFNNIKSPIVQDFLYNYLILFNVQLDKLEIEYVEYFAHEAKNIIRSFIKPVEQKNILDKYSNCRNKLHINKYYIDQYDEDQTQDRNHNDNHVNSDLYKKKYIWIYDASTKKKLMQIEFIMHNHHLSLIYDFIQNITFLNKMFFDRLSDEFKDIIKNTNNILKCTKIQFVTNIKELLFEDDSINKLFLNNDIWFKHKGTQEWVILRKEKVINVTNKFIQNLIDVKLLDELSIFQIIDLFIAADKFGNHELVDILHAYDESFEIFIKNNSKHIINRNHNDDNHYYDNHHNAAEDRFEEYF